MTAAVGDSKFNLNHDGMWYQNGFPHGIENEPNSFRIGFETYLLPWLYGEVAFENYGSISGATWHVSDENYNPALTPACNNPCEAVRVAYWTGKASALTMSLKPNYRWIYGRIGASYYQADFKATNTNLKDSFVPEALPSVGDYDYDKVRGLTYHYGFGLQMGQLYLEYSYSPIKVDNSAFVGVRNIWLGYRF